jgi:hypothetical protein
MSHEDPCDAWDRAYERARDEAIALPRCAVCLTPVVSGDVCGPCLGVAYPRLSIDPIHPRGGRDAELVDFDPHSISQIVLSLPTGQLDIIPTDMLRVVPPNGEAS